ncbi:hypothetical protein KVR01_010361 [Diaporthe batatas]|uniref:uncharacterized protein n=1 Tax=Diaporthe batatas TaxID=748121 RepID=UPI001D054896|nr:uncharacterized protein KVR01_010361 [Diaporthe batatas]KAG8159724.1 hypothetical protein KVR01_010361 [Diaporthe batatas]
MPAFSMHHCPKCGRVGNKRCIANGHYADCEVHPGSFHSIYTECVKCANQRQIDEQEQRAALERANQEEENADKNDKKKNKAKTKTQKAKPDSEKSMKQLRKEKKEKRRMDASDDPSPPCRKTTGDKTLKQIRGAYVIEQNKKKKAAKAKKNKDSRGIADLDGLKQRAKAWVNTLFINAYYESLKATWLIFARQPKRLGLGKAFYDGKVRNSPGYKVGGRGMSTNSG